MTAPGNNPVAGDWQRLRLGAHEHEELAILLASIHALRLFLQRHENGAVEFSSFLSSKRKHVTLACEMGVVQHLLLKKGGLKQDCRAWPVHMLSELPLSTVNDEIR